MIIYHYTSPEALTSIRSVSEDKDRGGIRPVLSKKYSLGEKAIYGLLEPEPRTWVSNGDFPLTWTRLWNHLLDRRIGLILLELALDPAEGLHVADRAHIEGFEQEKTMWASLTPDKYKHQTWDQAVTAYRESKTKLDQYLINQDYLGFSLPEVVITQDIPLDQIRISSDQPLLESHISWMREYHHVAAQRKTLDDLAKVPEIDTWLREHGYRTPKSKPEGVTRFKRKEF